jgi:hypothetical protein
MPVVDRPTLRQSGTISTPTSGLPSCRVGTWIALRHHPPCQQPSTPRQSVLQAAGSPPGQTFFPFLKLRYAGAFYKLHKDANVVDERSTASNACEEGVTVPVAVAINARAASPNRTAGGRGTRPPVSTPAALASLARGLCLGSRADNQLRRHWRTTVVCDTGNRGVTEYLCFGP